MNLTAFVIEKGPREAANKLEKHLIEVAEKWCNGEAVKPIPTLTDFKKRLESEAAWYSRDHEKVDSASIIIGEYDEDMLFIKPKSDVRATVTIRLVNRLELIEQH